ncbi:hypothetical protein QCE49_24090 [Caballeronia sp. LZ008]|uniref:hypothetical protein n=1 Tax=unclassified Caballeronia TaxID=2646786 RepID=UPI002028E93C|nr:MULTISPECIES: hypothetical protein [unclassified Caballeronia]MDR5796470.1 hypothetical protein [Caballeronia sp. LZ008]
MKCHILLRTKAMLLAVPVLLAGCAIPESNGSSVSVGTPKGAPTAAQSRGLSPAQSRSVRESASLPALRGPQDVPSFVAAASVAPVSKREVVRSAIQASKNNEAIASELITEFNRARKVDFSQALVVLSLIGEQRSSTGTKFLIEFLHQPLPLDGQETSELGLSPEAEAMERLQVKAANGLPYARTAGALQATLEVVAEHPLKPVRVEAASSYLWNAGNTDKARRRLSQYLREDERLLVHRPVRVDGMSPNEFNRQLAVYAERYPELKAPEPTRAHRAIEGEHTFDEPQISPPTDRSNSDSKRQQ